MPTTTFPCAVNAPVTVSALAVTRAAAVTGLLNVVVAYTVRGVLALLSPMTVLP